MLTLAGRLAILSDPDSLSLLGDPLSNLTADEIAAAVDSFGPMPDGE